MRRAARTTRGPVGALAAALLSIAPAAAFQDRSPDGPLPAVVLGDLRIAVSDAAGFFTAPLRFGSTDVDRLAALGGVAAALFASDESLQRLFTRNRRSGALPDPLRFGEEWGRLRTMQYAGLGLYAAGLVAGNEWTRVTGRQIGEALLLAGLPAIALQYGLGRSRPYGGAGAWSYNYLEWGNEFQSFPSGHTTVAFAVSTVLEHRIGNAWAGGALYLAAASTAAAAVRSNQHWPSDVFAGAVLGYLAGRYVVEREEERRSRGAQASPGRTNRLRAGAGPRGVTLRWML